MILGKICSLLFNFAFFGRTMVSGGGGGGESGDVIRVGKLTVRAGLIFYTSNGFRPHAVHLSMHFRVSLSHSTGGSGIHSSMSFSCIMTHLHHVVNTGSCCLNRGLILRTYRVVLTSRRVE